MGDDPSHLGLNYHRVTRRYSIRTGSPFRQETRSDDFPEDSAECVRFVYDFTEVYSVDESVRVMYSTCTLKLNQRVSICTLYATIYGHTKYEIHNVTEYGYGVRKLRADLLRLQVSYLGVAEGINVWFDGGHDPAQSALSYVELTLDVCMYPLYYGYQHSYNT